MVVLPAVQAGVYAVASLTAGRRHRRRASSHSLSQMRLAAPQEWSLGLPVRARVEHICHRRQMSELPVCVGAHAMSTVSSMVTSWWLVWVEKQAGIT